MSGVLLAAAACGAPGGPPRRPIGPIAIDRFSAAAGHLMVRGGGAELPAAGAPIDFDRPPFVTQASRRAAGWSATTTSTSRAPRRGTLYRVVRPATGERIAGQPDLIDVLPGEPGYSDFWRLTLVDAPAGAGVITDVAQLRGAAGRPQDRIVDCPVVPAGSTARLGAEPHDLAVRGQRVTCLAFAAPLAPDARGQVPTSPIYVTFAKSGFRTEDGTPQTHNVVFSVPGDLDYSPLWAVHVYDGSAFATVHDAASAEAAPQVKLGPLVNCPIVTPAQPVVE